MTDPGQTEAKGSSRVKTNVSWCFMMNAWKQAVGTSSTSDQGCSCTLYLCRRTLLTGVASSLTESDSDPIRMKSASLLSNVSQRRTMLQRTCVRDVMFCLLLFIFWLSSFSSEFVLFSQNAQRFREVKLYITTPLISQPENYWRFTAGSNSRHGATHR